ncbi:MAG: LysM peptidoglycan-binding domain-containing protein [Chromatiales bacterium]|jgi:hypothetical protein|nr:LysM peptidoglycan-binding domain-containing protein [Chromatiales bacterium]
MSTWRLVLGILGGCIIHGAVLAQATLKPGHPESYTVQEGDTLWQISAEFLSEPWRWQEVWERNPQVKNPDLIYPGDVLQLSYRDDGTPVIRLAREGRPVIRLSPKVRIEPGRTGAIPTIPIDAIRQFLSRSLVIEEDSLDDAPYIVSLGAERLIGGAGSKVYARGVDSQRGLYTVLRRGDPYVDPDDPNGEVLGYEALHIADASLERQGDPSTLRLVRSKREVLIGDRMVPAASDEGIGGAFMPHPPSSATRGKVISVVEGVTQIGQLQVVVLNLGKNDGLDAGTVLSVYQRGEIVIDSEARDPNAKLPEPDVEIELDVERQRGFDGLTMALDRLVRDIHTLVQPKDNSHRLLTLPEEEAGTVMVFRVFDRVSYALVMDATRAMHVADTVVNP